MRYLLKIALFSALLNMSLNTTSVNPADAPVYLNPPGMRAKKDPSIVIPAAKPYLNQPPQMPAYRNASGKPGDGWTRKYIDTRRFSSDQSAWIYYRTSDFLESKTAAASGGLQPFRIWPAGTKIILESYRGDAAAGTSAGLIEIVVMEKMDETCSGSAKSFYSPKWSYARFTPRKELSITPEKVLECHRCHSIAFRLTGDLVFTPFP